MTKDRTYTVIQKFIGLKVSLKVFLVFGGAFQADSRGFLFSVSDVSKLYKRSVFPTSDTMVLDLAIVYNLLFDVFNHFIARDVSDRYRGAGFGRGSRQKGEQDGGGLVLLYVQRFHVLKDLGARRRECLHLISSRMLVLLEQPCKNLKFVWQVID